MSNEQEQSGTKAHPADTLVIRHFYGWYEDSEAAPIGLGRQRTWKHNINCSLTRDEQIKFNSENHTDFRLSEYIPPALKIVFR